MASNPPPATSSSDVTTAQNLVQAMYTVANTIVSIAGQINFPAIDATTLVLNGQGRVCMVSITTAGSATGTIYDANNLTDTSRPIWTIPTTVTNPLWVNIPVSYGIVVVPGTGQVITVTYSKQTRPS